MHVYVMCFALYTYIISTSNINYTLYHEQGTNINIVFFVHDIPNSFVNEIAR